MNRGWWHELCEYVETTQCDFVMSTKEFYRIKALVEAAKAFDVTYRYSGKVDWIPALNKLNDALKALEIGVDDGSL